MVETIPIADEFRVTAAHIYIANETGCKSRATLPQKRLHWQPGIAGGAA
jgi:hypothetical protein